MNQIKDEKPFLRKLNEKGNVESYSQVQTSSQSTQNLEPTSASSCVSKTNQIEPKVQQNIAFEPADVQWITIDQEFFPEITMPRLIRNNEKYLSVRIIEKTILNQFEHINSPELQQIGRLDSIFMNESECLELNKINSDTNRAFGEQFTDQESLVKLDDFLKYYEIMKRTCKLKDKKKQLYLNNINLLYKQQQQKQKQILVLNRPQQQIIPQNNISQFTSTVNPIISSTINNSADLNNVVTSNILYPNIVSQLRSNINNQELTKSVNQTIDYNINNQYNTNFSPLPTDYNSYNQIQMVNSNARQINSVTNIDALSSSSRQQCFNSPYQNQLPKPPHLENKGQTINQIFHNQNLIQSNQQNQQSIPRISSGRPQYISSFSQNNSTQQQRNMTQVNQIQPNMFLTNSNTITNSISDCQQNISRPLSSINCMTSTNSNHNTINNFDSNNSQNTNQIFSNSLANNNNNQSILLPSLSNNNSIDVRGQALTNNFTNRTVQNNNLNSCNLEIINKNVTSNNCTAPSITLTPNTTTTTSNSDTNNKNNNNNNKNNINIDNDSGNNSSKNSVNNNHHQNIECDKNNCELNSDKILNGSPTKSSNIKNVNNINSYDTENNDDVLIIEPDEQSVNPFETKKTNKNDRKVSNSKEKIAGIIEVDGSSKDGFLQIDNYVIPYINLTESDSYCIKKYHFTTKCCKYIPCDLLDKFGLVNNKKDLPSNKTFKVVNDKTLIDKMNKLINDLKQTSDNCGFEYFNKDQYYLYDENTNPLEMINLFEIIFFSPIGQPNYVKYLNYSNPFESVTKNFNEILNLKGGVISIKIDDTKRLILMPFIQTENKIIVPYRYLKRYIKACDMHLDSNENDPNSVDEDLKKYIYLTNDTQNSLFNKFTLLMLIYSSTNELNEDFQYVDCQKWILKFSQKIDYIYEFKRDKFPTCWLAKKEIGMLYDTIPLNQTNDNNIIQEHVNKPTTSTIASSSQIESNQTETNSSSNNQQNNSSMVDPANEKNNLSNEQTDLSCKLKNDQTNVPSQENEIQKYESKIKNCKNTINENNLTDMYRKLKNLTNLTNNNNVSANNESNIHSGIDMLENNDQINQYFSNSEILTSKKDNAVDSSNNNTCLKEKLDSIRLNSDKLDQNTQSSSEGFKSVKILLMERCEINKDEIKSLKEKIEPLVKNFKLKNTNQKNFRKRSFSETLSKNNAIEYLTCRKETSKIFKKVDNNKKSRIETNCFVDSFHSFNEPTLITRINANSQKTQNVSKSVKMEEDNLQKENSNNTLKKTSEHSDIIQNYYDVKPCTSKDTEPKSVVRKIRSKKNLEHSKKSPIKPNVEKGKSKKKPRIVSDDEENGKSVDLDDNYDTDTVYPKDSTLKLSDMSKKAERPSIKNMPLLQNGLLKTEEDDQKLYGKFNLKRCRIVINNKLDRDLAIYYLNKLRNDISNSTHDLKIEQNHFKEHSYSNKFSNKTSKKTSTSKFKQDLEKNDDGSNSLPDLEF